MLAVKEILILCGLAGFFEEYVPVFLAGENVYRNLRGVQKFVDTKVVRRDCIGSNLVSANSVTPLYFFDFRCEFGTHLTERSLARRYYMR